MAGFILKQFCIYQIAILFITSFKNMLLYGFNGLVRNLFATLENQLSIFLIMLMQQMLVDWFLQLDYVRSFQKEEAILEQQKKVVFVQEILFQLYALQLAILQKNIYLQSF
eukprot:TRINITY_DN3245_c0_g2_i1.p4 TRINITY_DN3245_c0_g2~~TRINITY_DN3245_c0_g2_i1.p4  ORF type:complete len:111 (-),score=6.38 TRINITY_DN3245_c0_g2_i1:742-1074(-)